MKLEETYKNIFINHLAEEDTSKEIHDTKLPGKDSKRPTRFAKLLITFQNVLLL